MLLSLKEATEFRFSFIFINKESETFYKETVSNFLCT